MRLCAGLGLPLEVVEPCGFPLSDRALRRAAMDYGALCKLVRRSDWRAFLEAPERRAGRLVLFTTRATRPLHDFVFRPGDTLLFGRERAPGRRRRRTRPPRPAWPSRSERPPAR